MNETAVASLLTRDRLIVGCGLALVTALAWVYLLAGAGMDMDMAHMSMPMAMPWSASYALVVLLMWWIMMIAMMLPSAAPMILLFAAVNRRSRTRGAPYVPTGVFAGAYLLVWGAFSLAATLAHWLLDSAGLLSPAMASTSAQLGGWLLVAAGVYQMTPLKHACLRHCRGPVEFITRHWRPGYRGALRMGASHGAYCVGCCWVIMGLLFFGGVMNFLWIVGLAVLVLLEKILPGGHRFGWLSGAGFLVWGAWLLA